MSVVIPSLRAAIAVPGWAKNELWRKARAVPSLDLRFDDNKSLVDAVTGASLVTFTRAGNGTYIDSAGVLQTAATDVPRFDHDPTTGESLGLLVEEQRTNLLLQSNGFDTTWANSNSSETSAAGTAPDGTNTAWEIKDTLDVSTVIHSIYQNFTSVTGTTYTFSVWAKAGTLPGIVLSLPTTIFGANLVVRFDLQIGTIISASAGTTNSIVAYSDGWYRLAVTATATGSASGQWQFRIDNGSAGSYQGDGTGTILIWGAQLEDGSFPTSYIPTTTAAVTRNADLASITGTAFSGWYRQDEGTVFAEATPIGDNGSNQFVYALAQGTGIAEEIFLLKTPGTNSITNTIRSSSTGTFTNNTDSLSPFGSNFKNAIAASSTSTNSAVNGVIQGLDTSVVMPTIDNLVLGRRASTTFLGNFLIRRLTYWPQRLPDDTLQTITV